MNKEEFIEYVIENNYEYYENKDEVHINEIVDDLGNSNEMITYYKNTSEIELDYLKENGSFKTRILNNFEQEVVKYFNSLNMIKEIEEKDVVLRKTTYRIESEVENE